MKRILVAALALAACSRGVSVGTDKEPTATATITDTNGTTVGYATITQKGNGVLIALNAQNLPAGTHGVHLHPIGNCDPAGGYAAAGSHLNPTNKQHGLNNPQGPHAGDLPSISIGADGKGTLRATNDRVTLESLFDADGSAILIHANADDNVSQPAGNSGAKIACGVLRR